MSLSRKRCKIVTNQNLAVAVSFISFVKWRRPASASPQLVNWHQRRQSCRVLRREGWRSMCYRNVLPSSYVRHDASPKLLLSFHWGSAASDDAFACQSSALDRNSEGRRLKIGDNWSYAPLWKISGYATGALYLAVVSTHMAVGRAFSIACPTVWNSLPDDLRLRDPAWLWFWQF